MEKRASDVRLHLPAPIFPSHFNQRLIDDPTSIVDQHVELAKVLYSQGDSCFSRAVDGNISHERNQSRTLQGFHIRIDIFGNYFGTTGM
ncbi:hypothetical protein D3C84_872990 [compost metagenome]